METPEEVEALLRAKREDWDRRALENARHFVANEREEWSDEEFNASGARCMRDFILTDMTNICQGKPSNKMCVLEIGCGVGRVTRALAEVFGEIHGADVSGQMIAEASRSLARYPNVYLYQNNGMDLSVLARADFDFAFSTIVFQHIPSRTVIGDYFREVARALRKGALFKCEGQGAYTQESCNDTWVGSTILPDEAKRMAHGE